MLDNETRYQIEYALRNLSQRAGIRGVQVNLRETEQSLTVRVTAGLEERVYRFNKVHDKYLPPFPTSFQESRDINAVMAYIESRPNHGALIQEKDFDGTYAGFLDFVTTNGDYRWEVATRRGLDRTTFTFYFWRRGAARQYSFDVMADNQDNWQELFFRTARRIMGGAIDGAPA